MQSRASSFFKKRIKELRKLQGWTQEQAAEACGLDYKLYQFYELGIKANPGLITLEKIARGFRIEIFELFSPDLTASPTHKPTKKTKRRSRSKLVIFSNKLRDK
jgi:transcriptional regulator with XRE-family HTH domain